MVEESSDQIEVNLSNIEFDDQGRVVLPSGVFADHLRTTIQATDDEIGTLGLKVNGSCPSINHHCS